MGWSLFTSESITEGHPDKICDQIADKILDQLLKHDPQSRCACEVTAEPGAIHIMGEITTNAQINYDAYAREVLRDIGYTHIEYGFTDQCNITISLHQQSSDIALGVDCSLESKGKDKKEIGAGDQGMMFGYACNETENYMPLAIQLANDLTRELTRLRKERILPYLRPDGKSQVTVAYENGVPAEVTAIVVSAQHDPDIDMKQLREDIYNKLICTVIPKHLLKEDTRIYINPTGRFVLGGPAADTGLTGRKIIADTYGGYAHHGGGAFSGKDPTKVDRSAAYMARYIAKHIVAAGIADKCELQISYSIGVAEPVSITVNTFGTGSITEKQIEEWISKYIDLRPSAIIERLQLRRPVYYTTAAYGHFGKENCSWEILDEKLLSSLKKLQLTPPGVNGAL